MNALCNIDYITPVADLDDSDIKTITKIQLLTMNDGMCCYGNNNNYTNLKRQ